MLRYSIFAVLVVTLLTGITFAMQERQEQDKDKKQDDKILLPATGADAMARRDFMRTKLMYSQNIFEGLTTGNFDLIKSGIEEVRQVTKGEQWVQIDDDRYRKLTADFKTTIDRLAQAAENGNIDSVALRYYQMSTSCIDCHKHIRIADYDF